MSDKEIKQSLELYDYILDSVKKEYSNLLCFAEAFYKKKQVESNTLQKYPNVRYVESNYSSLIVNFQGKDVKVMVDLYGSRLFCQVEYCSKENMCNNDVLSEKVKDILTENHGEQTSQRWKYFDRLDYIGVCEMYEKVINRLSN